MNNKMNHTINTRRRGALTIYHKKCIWGETEQLRCVAQNREGRQTQRLRHAAVHQTKPCIRLINKLQVYHQVSLVLATFTAETGADSWPASYLVLLLESVALRALHLGDVLEEVGHADRRVQLTRLVRHIHLLPLPQGVSVRLHQAAGVAAHVLAFVCGGTKTGTHQSGSARRDGKRLLL